MMTRSFNVERNVSIRSNATQEEAYTAHFADLFLIVLAELVEIFNGFLLQGRSFIRRMIDAQAQVNNSFGKNFRNILTTIQIGLIGFRNIKSINKKCLFFIKSKSFNIKTLDKVVERALVQRIKRKKLVNHYKIKRLEIRP